MKFKLCATLMVCLLILFSGSQVSAFIDEDIELHGFVSQGYLRSSENNYLGNSRKGSYEFNEIGINIATPLTDDLNFGIQFFSRDMGDYGNNDLVVDWAALDYNWRDWLGFRAGKIKLPYGLYNRKRNADMLRTAVIFPQSVYPEGMREFVVGIYGVSFHGTQHIGALGYLDYELYGGTVSIPTASGYIQQLLYQYRAFITDDSIRSALQLAIRHVEGFMLIWNTPLTGLRIGSTGLMGSGEISLDSDVIDLSIDVSIDEISTLSLEYDIKNITFSSEYMRIRIDTKVAGLTSTKANIDGWYAKISWQATDWFALSTSYGEYFPNAKDKDGAELTADDERDFFGWQKDFTISTKFNVTEYWCIKFETHFINGLGLASLEDNPASNAEEDWVLFAAKTSLNF